jgi:hypothetical protein
LDRVLLHPWQNVRIKINRDADPRVPEPFRGDLRVDAAREQMRRVRVA